MERVGSPAVSRDGRWVVVPVTEPAYDEKKEVADLWIVPADGSAKPRRITNSPLAARSPVWSPDGQSILYQAPSYKGAADAEANKKIAAERKDARSKVRAYDGFPIRRWDRWLDDTETHLFVVPSGGGAARDLLAGTQLVSQPGFAGATGEGSGDSLEPTWAPDGRSIVFVATTNRETAAYAPTSTGLFELAASGGEPRPLTTGHTSYAHPAFTPDGKSVCFRAGDEWGKIYALDRLACAPWPWSGQVTTVTPRFDRSVAEFAIAPDSRTLYLTAEDSGYVSLYSVPARGGNVTPVYGRELMMGTPFWENPRPWLDQSPIAYAKDFKTPILLSVGENDFRVPMNNTLEMYAALQRMRVPTRLLVWPDENHWILKGENSRVFYREVRDWMARWLK